MSTETKPMTGCTINLDIATDEVLTQLAARAFQRGLDDGRKLSAPRDSLDLIAHLDVRGRIFHRRKLRQVYGAGYDISAAMLRINLALLAS